MGFPKINCREHAAHIVLVDIVVHTASSAVPDHARNLIRALGQRRKHSGNEVYYIHVCRASPFFQNEELISVKSGITALFTEEAGWPFGEVKDSDNIYEKEKQIGPSNPVRAVSFTYAFWHCWKLIIDC